ncbi:MAG: sugar ABC transporter ATP-binding protein [Chloroflexi bacterium]|nr:sugar ABC transporter ATP-binding protein [Chloroflexota bacterium]
MAEDSGRAEQTRQVPLLEVRSITKSFPGVYALRGVNLTIRKGEIVGLVGENGAGKSTLMNILSGVDHPEAGSILLHGHPIAPRSYYEATLLGIFRIYQEQALVSNIPIFENLFLSHEGHFSRFGLLNRRAMIRAAQQIFKEFGHEWINPTAITDTHDFSTRQVIEIIRAFALANVLHIDTPVILLDEPTASLSKEEIDFLGKLLRGIKHRAGILFVSHRLSEVLELSDRIYIQKDGEMVAEVDAASSTERTLHELMVGRVRDEEFYKENRQRQPDDTVLLTLNNCSGVRAFRNVNLRLHAGEILGIGGVLGSGKSELGRAIAGAFRLVEGSIEVFGRTLVRPTIQTMMEAGVGYVAPERHEDGIILSFPLSWNISLARTAVHNIPPYLLDLRRERVEAISSVQQLQIRPPNITVLARHLSGGNQQKAVLARWLVKDVRILILDNPTRGIDAGAKEELYTLVRELTAKGVAIILISDDLLELIGLSNRIIVMRDGKQTLEVATPQQHKPQEAELVAQMV